MECLSTTKNVFELYQDFSHTIADVLSNHGILDLYQSRGAFAEFWNTLANDLKSVAASGWTPDLIPDDEILQSQFPDVLKELKEKEARRDELEAMFKEVNELEEDQYNEDDYDIFPKDVLADYRSRIKEEGAKLREVEKEINALKRRYSAVRKSVLRKVEKEKQDKIERKIAAYEKGIDPDLDNLIAEIEALQPQAEEIEKRKAELEEHIAKHIELENELKECKNVMKEIKDRKADLVDKAREKISPEEAKALILARWKRTLTSTIDDYLKQYQRKLLVAVESLWEKYTTPLNTIKVEREQETNSLNRFLTELGYDS